MSVFAGVDGGGTRTRAVLIDAEGRELGRAEHEGAVVTAHRPEDAAEAVRKAVSKAADEAGVDLPVDVLWAGLAGAGAAAARVGVTTALRRQDLAERLIVGTDVEAAFHDAFHGEAGVMLIAGTGSIAWARDRAGQEHRVGGWGRLIGDEGSGYWIGMEGLRAVTRAEDGREGETALAGPLLDRCDVESVDELVVWVDGASKGDVAALAPLVIEGAEAGDAVAEAVVDSAVEALRAHVEAALSAVGSAPDDVDDGGDGQTAGREGLQIVLWGGLVAPGGPLRGRLEGALRGVGVDVETRAVDPPMGAADLARSAVSGSDEDG